MERALRSIVLAALLVLAGCPGDEPEGEADASSVRPDATAVAFDASQEPGLDATVVVGADAGAEPGADAATGGNDAATPGQDAATAGQDAASPGQDASNPGVDAGPATSPAVSYVGAESDALASYLINASPAAWNIFYGDSVPLGRHFDLDHVSYYTALRFPSVRVPPGATVTSARLTFYPTNAVDSSNNLWINVYAEKAGDSAAFDPTNYLSGRPDQRARTTAFVDHWLVRCNDACTDLTEYDCPQRKLDCWDPATAFTCPKDLKAMVQEVVGQAGWATGNAMTILLINSAIDDDGVKYQSSRSIVGYDTTLGASYAPKLVVEFTP